MSDIHILVTNDDGITAPGLVALAREMMQLGRVSVLAPDRNWSASGHVKTLERPLRVKEVTLLEGVRALATDGAPSDAVALALLGLIDKVNLVVSGINPYANLGDDVTYSGTVTAAMEAAIGGVPGIAVSLNSPDGFSGVLDYGPAARVARRIAAQVIEHGLPAATLLNVNVPYLPDDQMKCVQVTRQGVRVYRDELVRRDDPRGRPYYWIGGDAPTGVPDEGTDFGALKDGCISVTPLHLDLTAYSIMDEIKKWNW